jgi:hypothetical protein
MIGYWKSDWQCEGCFVSHWRDGLPLEGGQIIARNDMILEGYQEVDRSLHGLIGFWRGVKRWADHCTIDRILEGYQEVGRSLHY